LNGDIDERGILMIALLGSYWREKMNFSLKNKSFGVKNFIPKKYILK